MWWRNYIKVKNTHVHRNLALSGLTERDTQIVLVFMGPSCFEKIQEAFKKPKL